MSRPQLATLPDLVDLALAAAAAPAPQVQLGQVDVNLSTGRQARLICPLDLTDAEILDMIAGLSTQLRQATIQARRADPRNRIVLPGG